MSYWEGKRRSAHVKQREGRKSWACKDPRGRHPCSCVTSPVPQPQCSACARDTALTELSGGAFLQMWLSHTISPMPSTVTMGGKVSVYPVAGQAAPTDE